MSLPGVVVRLQVLMVMMIMQKEKEKRKLAKIGLNDDSSLMSLSIDNVYKIGQRAKLK